MNKLIGVIMVSFLFLTLSLTGCGKTTEQEADKQNNNSIVPEVPGETSDKPINDCELACANYVNKCLTLVPGATQQLYKEGLTSCVEECSDWGVEKTNCILTAENCTLMTDECKL